MVAGALAVCACMQATAQDPTGSMHGHVQNAAGVTMTKGDVELTTDSTPSDATKFKYDMPVDQNGNYKSPTGGIAAGTYTAVFMQDGKLVDMIKAHIEVNQDATVDFDMTRAEFLNRMTAPEKAELAAYKAKVAAATS